MIKILCTGDLHLRSTNPQNRKDNFFQSQLNKIEKILQIADEEKCNFLLCPGDVFDSPRPSFEVIEKIVNLFNKYKISDKIKFYTVWGQHDQIFRNKEKTALKLMETLGYIQILSKQEHKLASKIDLYGCNFGEEIPLIRNKDNFNILLIHQTILKKPAWEGQQDFLQSDKLFKQFSYDIICCGDWHQSVFYKNQNQTIFNCGCLVRKTISEINSKPHIYVIEIDENNFKYELTKHEISHLSIEDAFITDNLQYIKESNLKLDKFINDLDADTNNFTFDFNKNLNDFIIKNNISKEIIDIIANCKGEIDGIK